MDSHLPLSDAPGVTVGLEPAQDLLSRVRLDRFRFVGMPQGVSPVEALDTGTAALLLGFRRPASLDQVLAQGVPFRSSQMQRLMDRGLLEQRGMQFHTTFPMLLDDEAEAFRRRLWEVLPSLSVAVAPAFQGLYSALAEAGNTEAFPAIATWVLRERSWHYLIAERTVDVGGFVEAQRQLHPNAGWWGVLWYTDPEIEPANQFLSFTSGNRTLQLCWASGQAPERFMEPAGRSQILQFLAALDPDSRRVRDAERFAELRSMGVIGPEGTLSSAPLEWQPARAGGPAAAAEAAAQTVATAVAEYLPMAQLAELLGTESQVVAATVAYAELVPGLLLSLGGLGLDLLVDARSGAGTDETGSGAEAQAPTLDRREPVLSATIWLGLPRGEPAFPLQW